MSQITPSKTRLLGSLGVGEHLRASWYDQGLPRVELGHKLASSFMMSKVPRAALTDVRLPFHGFLISVPDGLLHLMDATKELQPVRVIAIGKHIRRGDNGEPCDSVAMTVSTKHSLTWSIQRTVAELLGEEDPDDEDITESLASEVAGPESSPLMRMSEVRSTSNVC